VLANAGPAGLTVPELVAATGRQKTWIFDRLGDLQQAGLVKRAGQGSCRLAQHPMRGGGAGS
jgi:DNA-binding IclR family transcriptional regulator